MYNVPIAPKHPSSRLRHYWLWLILPFLGLIAYFFAFWMLVFMQVSVIFGMIPTVIFAALTAYATLRLAVWLYLRLRRLNNGRAYVAAALGVAVWIGWVLFPVACDTHESWIDTPNKRCDCRGLNISFYPGGVTDSTETEYCIGREIF
jgi:hypothetical protein